MNDCHARRTRVVDSSEAPLLSNPREEFAVEDHEE